METVSNQLERLCAINDLTKRKQAATLVGGLFGGVASDSFSCSVTSAPTPPERPCMRCRALADLVSRPFPRVGERPPEADLADGVPGVTFALAIVVLTSSSCPSDAMRVVAR